MNFLILKLNATGDVVRNTPLLRCLNGTVTWVTAPGNVKLLDGVAPNLRCVSWEERHLARDRSYDLLLNLEDELQVAAFAGEVSSHETFGAYLADGERLAYTDNARGWFDMSLISAYGRDRADQLKLENRRSYQDLVFEGLGLRFDGEEYLLPSAGRSTLLGDVAMAPVAGPVWPMKNWAYYDELRTRLEANGLTVNVLPRRSTLIEHLADIRGHRCLVGGDSLPMHLALGVGVPCVTIFNCTSPWEIHDYGLQTKIVSPLLSEFFYKRGLDTRATTAVHVEEVLDAVHARLRQSGPERTTLDDGRA